MQWKIPENSIFAMLMRRSWWVSALASLVTFLLVQLFVPWAYALFCASPFIVITLIVAWNQAYGPNGVRVAKTLEHVRNMSWEEFAQALERGYKAEGYTVRRVDGVADLELENMGYLTLVSARRWKAARTGIEPLRDLVAEGEQREARECRYVVAGELTDQARAFAQQKRVRLVAGAELARLVRG
ncbi:MAG: restriction endonuclease [Betaproteobacteria bacterium]|jgi:restriction system protein|nr:restriction endonuclease [Betaproteobacteria bacterium]